MGLIGFLRRPLASIRRKKAKKKRFDPIPIIRPKNSRLRNFMKGLAAGTGIGALLLVLLSQLFSGAGTKLVEKIHRLGKSVPPLAVRVELTKPTPVSGSVSDSDYISPPMIEVTATSNIPLKPDGLGVQFGKIHLHKGSPLREVERKYIRFRQRDGGRRLIATLDTAALIRSCYPETPHGLYRAEFALAGHDGAGTCSTKLEFNYVYTEDFTELKEALVTDDKGFTSIRGNGPGLEINSKDTRTRCISADIIQLFDFKTNFYILGFFTMELEDAFKPCGLDVVICDESGWLRLSTVLVDGHLNGFSMKTLGEKIGDKHVKVRCNRTRVVPTTERRTVYNYFLICISEQDGGHLCTLYVNPDLPEFGPNSRAHERLLSDSVFRGTGTRIKLRLWQAGAVDLYGFKVAEFVKGKWQN